MTKKKHQEEDNSDDSLNSRLHGDEDSEKDLDLTDEEIEKDLPPIIDGDFEELEDDDIDKEFDSHRHYEDEIDEDEDEDF